MRLVSHLYLSVYHLLYLCLVIHLYLSISVCMSITFYTCVWSSTSICLYLSVCPSVFFSILHEPKAPFINFYSQSETFLFFYVSKTTSRKRPRLFHRRFTAKKLILSPSLIDINIFPAEARSLPQNCILFSSLLGDIPASVSVGIVVHGGGGQGGGKAGGKAGR